MSRVSCTCWHDFRLLVDDCSSTISRGSIELNGYHFALRVANFSYVRAYRALSTRESAVRKLPSRSGRSIYRPVEVNDRNTHSTPRHSRFQASISLPVINDLSSTTEGSSTQISRRIYLIKTCFDQDRTYHYMPLQGAHIEDTTSNDFRKNHV